MTSARAISIDIVKIAGLTVLLFALMSLDYAGAAISTSASQTPVQLLLVALIETSLLSYFVVSSLWTGWKQWAAVFAVLYGMEYALTAMETIYVGSVLTPSMAAGLLVNGAITSAIFSWALVRSSKNKEIGSGPLGDRLRMGTREWAWKIVASAAIYLLLFVLFGVAVYDPIAKSLAPAAFAKEQASVSTAAAFVFPVEFFRAIFFALLAVPAILALPFGWKKTGAVVALLMSMPVSLSLFLSNSMALGLQIGHFFETFGEITIFGLLLVWILQVHSRLPAKQA